MGWYNNWLGDNMQGQINSIIINKYNIRAEIMHPLGQLNVKDVFLVLR